MPAPGNIVVLMVRKAFPAKVIVSVLLAFLLVGGIVVAGATLRDSPDDPAAAGSPSESGSAGGAATTSTAPTTTTSTVPATTVPTIPQLAQPAAATTLPVIDLVTSIGPGASPGVVQPFEQRLVDLKFDPGAVDGIWDQAMTYAVQAVQKIAALPRSGRIGAAEAAALSSFQYPAPLHPDAEANRTEIDVTKQVITLYESYQVRLITTTSTASGQAFCSNTPKRAPTQHICEVATTPSGRYTYYLFRQGVDEGDLGGLYNPYYFFKGRAIHGYESVPTEPASHGCARIPMHISEYWHTLVHDGDAVYVDGGSDGEQILSSNSI
ncbi:MAG: L,D-transpeptidase family protein [Acidimicrobiia bacterium]|nr:L,D-transpeptidase family protein [Acidimicrobiia bacterium]